MDRITIYDTDTDGSRERLGWFDRDAATLVLVENQTWDGNNMRGTLSGLQYGRAELYRTSRGRWVDHTDASREYNGPNNWTFLTDDQARDWMMRSGGDDAEGALAKYFPDIPDESGPDPKGGRPAVGHAVSVAYPKDLMASIDAAADRSGLTRAAWLRQAAAAAVAVSEQHAEAGA